MHGMFVGRGMHGNRLDAHFTTCPQNSEGNFTTIGDENFLKHSATT